MIDTSFKDAIEQLKLRLPIEELVREYVPALKRQGALWVACCPFHEERTPSFKVDPRRGTWRCYGACGIGGDVIGFVERSTGTGFREAVEILAARAGIELPDPKRDRERQFEQRFAAVYEALSLAERFFQRILADQAGSQAREYLDARGLTEELRHKFGLGYAPGGTQLVDKARQAGLSLAVLEEAGLARQSERGAYDFFRERLTFPVRDIQGRTVGFGARRLRDVGDAPKYVNTPETVLFKKSRLIYGLDLALAAVRRTGHLILVEGYTDVMAAHQTGIPNVAAVLGTATTDDHAALVRRTGARRVSLVFDGDEAGRKATYKALYGLLPLDLEIDVVRLASNQDPCDFLLEQGREPFQARLERGLPWFDFLFEGWNALSDSQRMGAADRALELIARLARPLAQEARLSEFAVRANYALASVRAQFESLPERRRAERAGEQRPVARAKTAHGQGGGPVGAAPAARETERAAKVPGTPYAMSAQEARRAQARERAWREMLAAVVVEPELLERASRWLAECSVPTWARIFDAWREVLARQAAASQTGEPASVRDLLAELADAPERELVVGLLDLVDQAESPVDLFEGAQAYLERDQALSSVRELAQSIAHTLAREQAAPSDERELAPEADADAAERLAELHREFVRLHPRAAPLAGKASVGFKIAPSDAPSAQAAPGRPQEPRAAPRATTGGEAALHRPRPPERAAGPSNDLANAPSIDPAGLVNASTARANEPFLQRLLDGPSLT